MSNEDIDEVISQIIQKANKPMTIPQIEHVVVGKNIQADTYDVQRSVQRLVSSGRVSLTQRLDITSAVS